MTQLSVPYYDSHSHPVPSTLVDGTLPATRELAIGSQPADLSARLESGACFREGFKFFETLAANRQSRTYKAFSTYHNRFCTVKAIRKPSTVTQAQATHLDSERAILARMCHPRIADLWMGFQDETHVYLVLDNMPGRTLALLLDHYQHFSESASQFYAAEVLLALVYLHKHEVIHRNLATENIWLDDQGHIKLMDFEHAKHVQDMAWTVCGTPEYMAPEMILSKGQGTAVDYWSLGILIYEMMAGYPPFRDSNPFNVFAKIVDCQLSFPPHFGADLRHLLTHLLTPNPSMRYGNLYAAHRDVMHHPWFCAIQFDSDSRLAQEPPYLADLHRMPLLQAQESLSTPANIQLHSSLQHHFADF